MRSILACLTVLAVSCGSTSTRDAGAGGGTSGGLSSGGGFVAAGGSAAGGRAGGTSAGGSSGGSSAGGAAGGTTTGGLSCGGVTCSGATPACCSVELDGGLGLSCAASCADAGSTFACGQPSECDGDAGTPFCCASLDLGAGTFPSCPTQGLSSSCRATCSTTLALSCPTSGTARLCSHATDCAMSQKCCAFAQQGTTLQLCVSGTLPCANIP